MGVHFSRNYRLPMLVMEYLPLSLTQCLESHRDLPLQIKYSILLDVAKGLNYLHCKRPPIVHRDLTANNILLTSNFVAKISDLGVSRMADTFKHQELSVAPGNSVVMPPEALKDNPVYDHKLDVFSYGCLILHVFTHEWPKPSDQYLPKTGFFQRGNFTFVNEWERRQRYTSAISNDNPFYLFGKSCLENDPKKRPTMSDAIKCAQNAVSSLRPLKSQFDMMKEVNTLTKEVDRLKKKVQEDICLLDEERNKAQTNTYLLEDVMEQTQSYTQRLEQEKKKAQEDVNQLQLEKEKIQAYAHQMEQEKKKAQDNVNQLQQKKEKTDTHIYQLEQEKVKIQAQAHQLEQQRKRARDNVNQLQQEKEKADTHIYQLEQEKKRIQAQALDLKLKLKQSQQDAHLLEQVKEKVQKYASKLEIEKRQMQENIHRLEQVIQNYAKTLELEKKQTEEIVFKLEQEMKNQALFFLNKVEKEKVSLTRQVEDLERRLKQVQKISFIIIIVIIIAILLFQFVI